MFRDNQQRTAAGLALTGILPRVHALAGIHDGVPLPKDGQSGSEILGTLSADEATLWRLWGWTNLPANTGPSISELFRLAPEVREHTLNFLVAIHGGPENVDGRLATFRRTS